MTATLRLVKTNRPFNPNLRAWLREYTRVNSVGVAAEDRVHDSPGPAPNVSNPLRARGT